MEFGTIEREVYVEASPEIVFDVVSSPDHLKNWWPDEAHYEPIPGSNGRIVFGDPAAGGALAGFAVVDARPPRMFSFRWTHPVGESAAEGNSLLVTFDLTPSGPGTLLRMTETGFREMGWELAGSRGAVPRTHHRLGFLPAEAGAVRVDPAGATVSAALSDQVDDALWSAIGDPTRRRMLDLLLIEGHGTATSLGQHLPVTRQAVAKHLGVLDRVGLVRGTSAGREKRYRVDDAQLARAVAQMSSVGSAWDSRLQRIKQIAEAMQGSRPTPDTRPDTP